MGTVRRNLTSQIDGPACVVSLSRVPHMCGTYTTTLSREHPPHHPCACVLLRSASASGTSTRSSPHRLCASQRMDVCACIRKRTIRVLMSISRMGRAYLCGVVHCACGGTHTAHTSRFRVEWCVCVCVCLRGTVHVRQAATLTYIYISIYPNRLQSSCVRALRVVYVKGYAHTCTRVCCGSRASFWRVLCTAHMHVGGRVSFTLRTHIYMCVWGGAFF